MFTHNPIGYSKTLKLIKCKAEICQKFNQINLSMRINELLVIFRNSSIDNREKLNFELSIFIRELINQSVPPPKKK